jgi:hypothetical protein
MQDLFTQALGINSPWFIKDVRFEWGEFFGFDCGFGFGWFYFWIGGLKISWYH